jgi:hypothetical protein
MNAKTPPETGGVFVCSAVSYSSTRLGSTIGAGRLSFRVRDGTGRFPVAVTAVTLFKFVLVGGVVFHALRREWTCGCDVCW